MREAAFGEGEGKKFSYSLWDADMVHGCVCDDGFTGHDCSHPTCPTGDDPMTRYVEPVQTVTCALESEGRHMKLVRRNR